jgi:ParB-like chromosome segregation protein Spo0J
MKIETRPLNTLTPYARNPRKNAAAVATVKASLKEFGWQQPIVADADGVIIVGHTRYQAALELGMESAPVKDGSDMTPAQVKAYRLMDNKSHERAEWDAELTALELEDLKTFDFDLALTGFSDEEIDDILAKDPKLKEKAENLQPIRWTRILISIPTGRQIDELDAGLAAVLQAGGTIDYAGN